MYGEDDLLAISALQHLLFCERQCALIHLERVWQDNALTIEGTHLHARVDETAPRREVRGDIVVLRGLALRSLSLGLVGRADVVELRRVSGLGCVSVDGVSPWAVSVRGLTGRWRVVPVEYKRGRSKMDASDEVQLCAQALCLEEMLGVQVPEGAIFYGRQQRRTTVSFDRDLVSATTEAVARLHALIAGEKTPRAEPGRKCEKCSLTAACVPDAMSSRRSAARYVARAMREHAPQSECSE